MFSDVSRSSARITHVAGCGYPCAPTSARALPNRRVMCAECCESALRLYGTAVRQGCVGQLRALMLEVPLAYCMLLGDIRKKPAAHGGMHSSSVPLCVAISEYREMTLPSGTSYLRAAVKDMLLPDITILVGEIMSSVEVD